MYTGFQHLHSFFAWALLGLLLIAVFYSAYSWINKQAFTKKSKLIAILGLASTHLQVLVGLILYFISPLGLSNFSGEAMKNPVSRLYMLEHPLTMIIAAVLITIGYSKAKRQTEDQRKFKNITIFYTIGLILILSRIPWDAWL